MKSKRFTKTILVIVTAVCLTGCTERSAEGSLTAQGMDAIQALDYQAALEYFQQAVNNGEDDVPALRGAGMAYMGMAKYEEAVQVFDQALDYTDEKMPEAVRDIILYKASAQFRLKDYDGTIESCDQILEEEEVADAYFLRGASCLKLDYQDRAREDFDQAAKLTPEDYTLYLNIYECYEAQNLSVLGDEYLQTALNITPKGAEDYYCIGQIYYYLEQYDQAQNALISPVNEKYLPALGLMGRIYLAQNDYAHAKGMYQLIQQESGESAQTYNGLALCALASGEYDAALEYIQQGLNMEGDAGKQELFFNEIVAYERKLDFVTARVKAEAYTSLYPTDEAGQKELEFLSTR